MKLIYLAVATLLLTSCGGESDESYEKVPKSACAYVHTGNWRYAWVRPYKPHYGKYVVREVRISCQTVTYR